MQEPQNHAGAPGSSAKGSDQDGRAPEERRATPAAGTAGTPRRPTRRPGPLAPSERERAESARRRGLDAPFIPGGEAPDREAAEKTDRIYGRLLLVMIVVIVLSGFVLGIVANIIRILGG